MLARPQPRQLAGQPALVQEALAEDRVGVVEEEEVCVCTGRQIIPLEAKEPPLNSNSNREDISDRAAFPTREDLQKKTLLKLC